MRRKLQICTLAIVLLACVYAASQGTGKPPAAKPAAGSAAQHFSVAPAELKWQPLFLGLETAVVSGDPSKPGAPFVLRVRAKTAAVVAAHWHPQDENVTVLTGTVKLGMGEKYDAKAMQAFATGSYIFIPKGMRHFVFHGPGSVIQVHGTGPFVLNFVNPADDPRTAAPKQ